MAYRLTLPGGVVVDCGSAVELAEAVAALAVVPAEPVAATFEKDSRAENINAPRPPAWKPNRPNGRGCIERNGKRGFRWTIMIQRKRHAGPTVGSEAAAEESLAEFLSTGVMPPRPPRAPYRCGRCDAEGHTARRCPTRDLPSERQAASSAPAAPVGVEPTELKKTEPDPHSTKVASLSAPARVTAAAILAHRERVAAQKTAPEILPAGENITEPEKYYPPAAWNRSDPEEDLTDLDLGVPELPAPPPVEATGRDTSTVRCSACAKLGHNRRTCPMLHGTPVVVPAPLPVLVEPPRAETIEGQADPTAAQARIRAKLHVVNGETRVRAKTVGLNGANARLRRDERVEGAGLLDPAAYDRPRSRAECCAGGVNAIRPCPWVSCAHHLYVDVNEDTGGLKLNFPHLEVWEMAETCSLDVADRGGITLEEVGAILNLTRERIRQVEVRGLAKIKDNTGDELGLPPDRPDATLG